MGGKKNIWDLGEGRFKELGVTVNALIRSCELWTESQHVQQVTPHELTT